MLEMTHSSTTKCLVSLSRPETSPPRQTIGPRLRRRKWLPLGEYGNDAASLGSGDNRSNADTGRGAFVRASRIPILQVSGRKSWTTRVIVKSGPLWVSRSKAGAGWEAAARRAKATEIPSSVSGSLPPTIRSSERVEDGPQPSTGVPLAEHSQ